MQHQCGDPTLASKFKGLVGVTPIALWAPPLSTAIVVPIPRAGLCDPYRTLGPSVEHRDSAPFLASKLPGL
eukprot:12068786-Karenia_brevis.AAC.1